MNDEFKTHLHCGYCASEVPFEKEFVTHLFDRKTSAKGETPRWFLFVGFVCPKDLVVTEISYPTKTDSRPLMEHLNLYGMPVISRKATDLQEKQSTSPNG